jgi:hypothetical protein
MTAPEVRGLAVGACRAFSGCHENIFDCNTATVFNTVNDLNEFHKFIVPQYA